MQKFVNDSEAKAVAGDKEYPVKIYDYDIKTLHSMKKEELIDLVQYENAFDDKLDELLEENKTLEEENEMLREEVRILRG